MDDLFGFDVYLTGFARDFRSYEENVMGIYYYAVDENSKTIMTAPEGFSIKNPGCFHPDNPFPGMVMMKNIQGDDYKIFNDCGAFYETFCTWEDVTKKVYQEYLDRFKEEVM